MIKKILFFISSLLLLFPVSKVFALPSGEVLSDFAILKSEFGTFYVNNGNFWVSLYGNNGTGSACGTSGNPDPFAPISCWYNRTLSLSTYDLSNSNYYLTAFRLYTNVPLIVGDYYDVTISYTLSSTSYNYYKNLWTLSTSDYDVKSFESICNGVNCTINFTVKNLSQLNQNYIWLNLNSNTYTFSSFNAAVSYWYMPYVRPSSSSNDSIDLGPIIDQNQTIIDQNNQTNNKLDDINNSINSDNVDDFSDTINSFEGFLDENSTITKLITLPVTLYSSILNNVDSTCTPFNLGELYGEPLVLPCINIGNYLGSTLWGMIDLIISGFSIYAISKKFIKIFNNFSTLKEGDILDD